MLIWTSMSLKAIVHLVAIVDHIPIWFFAVDAQSGTTTPVFIWQLIMFHLKI
jgi:hypothetical protein